MAGTCQCANPPLVEAPTLAQLTRTRGRVDASDAGLARRPIAGDVALDQVLRDPPHVSRSGSSVLAESP